MAAMKPRTGDGPLEVTKEGRGIVLRMPIEGGGRLVVEMTPAEAAALARPSRVAPASAERPKVVRLTMSPDRFPVGAHRQSKGYPVRLLCDVSVVQESQRQPSPRRRCPRRLRAPAAGRLTSPESYWPCRAAAWVG